MIKENMESEQLISASSTYITDLQEKPQEPFRKALAKFGYKYVATQAGTDMFSKPKDRLIHPDLFLDPSGEVTIKSLVTGIEDQYPTEEVLLMLQSGVIPQMSRFGLAAELVPTN